MEDVLITVLGSNKFNNTPVASFRLIQKSDDYVTGFYQAVKECYPVNEVQLTKVK